MTDDSLLSSELFMNKDKVKQCYWNCECGKQCGGILNHFGKHQCPIHGIHGVFLVWK